MRTHPLALLALAAALWSAAPTLRAATEVSSAASALADGAQEARVIVRFKPAAPSVRAKALAAGSSRLEAREVAQTRATGLAMRQGLQRLGQGSGLRAGLSLDERTQVISASGISSAELVQRLGSDSEVELVVVDQRRRHTALTPNDPRYAAGNGGLPEAGQWYLRAPAGEVQSSINAPAAWDLSTGRASVVVAVLDTGVRKDHPDLAAQFVGGYDFVGFGSDGASSIPTANDGDRADADASDPGDWVSQADINSGNLGAGCTAEDIGNSSWHGTRVSGLIGAVGNNGQGMAGVSWGSKILPVRVLGKCGGFDSDIMAGMKWAAGIAVPGLPANPNVARVLNLSLGGSGACPASGTGALYRDTINQVLAQGASIVVAAGNTDGKAVGIPGNCPGVITVTGLRHAGSKVGFASLGPEVTLAAPGGNCVNVLSGQPCLYPMFSTTNRGTTTPLPGDASYTDGAASYGTSFSAPIVSGTVALMLSLRPTLSPAEVLALLKKTVRPFVSSGATAGTQQCAAPSAAEQLECYCNSSTCGAGMLDAAAALAATQALNTATVKISVSPAVPTAGQLITLSNSVLNLPTGSSIVSTSWSLADGGGIVSGFASGAASDSATLTPSGAGSFTVNLQLTDNQGLVYKASSVVTVAAAPVVTTPGTSTGGGGGGGAFSPLWLGLLMLAAWALRRFG